MQDLVKIHEGSDDIVVGISGFGSAKVPVSRWDILGELTGRTTYVLNYDAQELPFDISKLALQGVGPVVFQNAIELRRRWKVAREAARLTVPFLGNWVARWLQQGREVTLVGFSLGGFVAWLSARYAIEELGGEQPGLKVVLISAALGDRAPTWRGVHRMGHLLNLYSAKDLVLRRLYPMAVGGDETPAAGLGPLVLDSPNVTSLDVTDLVGRDHLWASSHVSRLAQIAMGCLEGVASCEAPWDVIVRESPEAMAEQRELRPIQLQRLYRWCGIDEMLWELLGRAMDGELAAVRDCAAIDAWSLEGAGDRLTTLMGGALTVEALRVAPWGYFYAQRNILELSGLTRIWLSRSKSPVATELPAP